MKILLVDDDAFLRDMYVTKFSEKGDEVKIAEDGDDALQRIKEENYDVVIMDMVMPGITGVKLLQAIQQIDTAHQTKCIVLSNQGERSDVDAALQAGAVGYIIKAELVPSQVVDKVHELASHV